MKDKEKYGLPEIYRFYKDKYFLKSEKEAFIDYKTFSCIIKDFNKDLAKLIIEEGVEFKMPVRLGSVRIRKYKKKIKLNPDGTIDKRNMSPNWFETKKLWADMYPGLSRQDLKQIRNKPIVYFLNEHTDGYKFILYWNKKGSNASNRKVYSIIFTYTNFRHLGKILQTDNKPDYYE